jgi:hypothetical protein
VDELIEALKAQTEALNRLAESNEALTCALFGQMAQESGDDDRPQTHYLDGSRAT